MKIILALVCFPLLLFSSPSEILDLPWIKALDSDAIKYAAPYLPKNPVILEAGVCDAEDTIRMKKMWPKSTIYGFEPLEELFTIATKKTTSLEQITIFPIALFNKIGQITFYRSSKIRQASSILEDNIDNIDMPSDIGHDGINYQDKPLTVNCTTIDHWALSEGVKKIDYLWLDTEGAELYILEKAETILPTVRVISIEANFKEFRRGMTLFPDLYDFLTKRGFTLKYI